MVKPIFRNLFRCQVPELAMPAQISLQLRAMLVACNGRRGLGLLLSVKGQLVMAW
jgi:hypothetical protein